MLNQFSRLVMLIGEEKLNLLSKKKIIVFGLGGVGGNVCDALIRSGITDITIVDNDVISVTNINRQLIANTKTIGKLKTDVMEEHLKALNPEIKVTKINAFYLPENCDDFHLEKYDYVVDAIDTITSKIDIIKRCKMQHIPVISALGCGNKLDPTKLEVMDLSKTSYDPLAKVLRRELRKFNITHVKVVCSIESPMTPVAKSMENTKKNIPGSSAFVPPVAGIIIASEVIKDLL